MAKPKETPTNISVSVQEQTLLVFFTSLWLFFISSFSQCTEILDEHFLSESTLKDIFHISKIHQLQEYMLVI